MIKITFLVYIILIILSNSFVSKAHIYDKYKKNNSDKIENIVECHENNRDKKIPMCKG